MPVSQVQDHGQDKSHGQREGREQERKHRHGEGHEQGKGHDHGRRHGHEQEGKHGYEEGHGRGKGHGTERRQGHEQEGKHGHGRGQGFKKGHKKIKEKKTKGRKAPHSREKEHKIIVSTANEICADIQKFVKKFLSGKKAELDYQQAIETLQHIFEMWKMDTVDDVPSWKDFIDVQDTQKIDQETKNTDGYGMLETICQRAKYFENLVPNVRKRMIACLQDHLYKYCKSFVDVAEGYDIRPVFDFDETIKENKTIIDTKLEAINTNIIQYGECKKPFAAFVREGASHGVLMEEICLYLVEICHIMKTWVRQDMDYPEKLHEEIQFSGSYNEKLVDDAKKLQSQREQLLTSLERRERQQFRMERDFDVSRRERRKLKKSRDTVETLLEKAEKKISDKEYEIDVLKDESKGSNTPRNKQIASVDMEKSKKDLVKLEERRTSLKRQLERLDKEYNEAADKHEEAKNNLEANEVAQEDISEGITDIDLELKNIDARTEAIDNKISVIRQIRELKLSPETLKKIHDKRKEKEKPPKQSKSIYPSYPQKCKSVIPALGVSEYNLTSLSTIFQSYHNVGSYSFSHPGTTRVWSYSFSHPTGASVASYKLSEELRFILTRTCGVHDDIPGQSPEAPSLG